MSKRIFIDGNINSELCIIATDGQDINYFDYSDELISSKKNNISGQAPNHPHKQRRRCCAPG